MIIFFVNCLSWTGLISPVDFFIFVFRFGATTPTMSSNTRSRSSNSSHSSGSVSFASDDSLLIELDQTQQLHQQSLQSPTRGVLKEQLLRQLYQKVKLFSDNISRLSSIYGRFNKIDAIRENNERSLEITHQV